VSWIASRDPDEVERFWSRHGWRRTPVDIRWSFAHRADLEAVVRIEFDAATADAVLAGHEGTEVDYAIEICAAVSDVIEPDTDRKLILNLPATVEMYTPNLYGDVIEYFHRHVPNRDRICLSLHPHNDQGTGVAAAQFGIIATGLLAACVG